MREKSHHPAMIRSEVTIAANNSAIEQPQSSQQDSRPACQAEAPLQDLFEGSSPRIRYGKTWDGMSPDRIAIQTSVDAMTETQRHDRISANLVRALLRATIH